MFWKRKSAARQPARGPAGRRLYAIGDVHGCAGLLAALRDAIVEDAAGAEAARTILLGDYGDRGPDTAGVYDLLLHGGLPDPVFLKGNHEAMLLDFLADPATGDLWRRNGCVETLASYGVDVRQMMVGREFQAVAEAFAENLPAEHRALVEGLSLSHREGDYFFCHAGIRPGVPLGAQRQEDLIWIREEFLGSAADHGAIVVHGHTPAAAPEVLANRINIDTGAFLSNRLTCLVIEGEERRLIQATPEGIVRSPVRAT